MFINLFLFLLATCVSLATCLLSQLDLVLHSLSKSEISTNSQHQQQAKVGTGREREREMRELLAVAFLLLSFSAFRFGNNLRNEKLFEN